MIDRVTAPATFRWPRSALLSAGVLLACAGAHAQDSVAAFYRGRTIPIIIGYPPGGSYDIYARLAAAHMGKYIPGHPNLIVQNKPGGIGVMRSFYETAPKDGSTIGIFPETIAIVQLTHPEIGKWRAQDLSYVGSFANVNAVFMVRKGAPATTVQELKTTSINVGCNTPVGVSYINPAIMKTFGGLKFKIICGYPGTASLPIALARGEIDMVTGAWTAWKNRPEVTSGGREAHHPVGLGAPQGASRCAVDAGGDFRSDRQEGRGIHERRIRDRARAHCSARSSRRANRGPSECL